MIIIGGTASHTTAQTIAQELNASFASVILKRFPDGEAYVRITDNVKGQDVVIVQTTYPDENIIELFLLQDAVRQAGAKTITVVIPYYGYSRQDKQFNDGEPISARTIAKHIELNADTVITIDPHKEHILDFFSITSVSASAIPSIAKYLVDHHVDFLLAPDKGALPNVKKACALVGCDYDYMEKTRIDGHTVEIKPKQVDVCGKHVAIIDDIISTGGTMAKSIEQLKKQGATKVSAACTHGLFIGDAIDKLTKAGCDDIIATDTIQNQYSKVSIAPCIAKILTETFS